MTHRDRVKDFERRVRAIERRVMWETLWFPLLCFVAIASLFLIVSYFYPTVGHLLVAAGSAIGLPLALWWGRPKK